MRRYTEPNTIRDERDADHTSAGPTEEQWKAITQNDRAYDERFLYAVKTTGIFCRPSCKSRPPRKDNVRLFRYAEEALSAGFRPCKRCKPTGQRLPDQEWVVQISRCLEQRYREPLTLGSLADLCHGSPYHLQRTFKRIQGMTPLEYLQQTRMAKAAELLSATNMAVADVAAAVGMPNVPYFHTLFKRRMGVTPAAYRQSEAVGLGG